MKRAEREAPEVRAIKKGTFEPQKSVREKKGNKGVPTSKNITAWGQSFVGRNWIPQHGGAGGSLEGCSEGGGQRNSEKKKRLMPERGDTKKLN